MTTKRNERMASNASKIIVVVVIVVA